jgi:predicted RNA-binding protein with PUA-like domain
MKRFDPAATAGEKHLRVRDVAERFSVSYSTALAMMKRNPKTKYLPCLDRRGRVRRTPLLPESALEEMYVRDMVE